MTWEIGILFALLGVMVYLFLTEKLPIDLTAFLGLVLLVFGGYVAPADAFLGFSSPAVITMMSIFIVSAGLLHTGVADTAGRWAHRLVGDREVLLIVVLMLVAGVLSAFMNNIAATAVLMPAVATISRRAAIPPSRLFMPLAFGAILGGTMTSVGTPPNILASEMLRERGLPGFALFDYAPMGLAMLGVGTLFMVTVGRRLLPVREHDAVVPDRKELAQVYALADRLFSIRIPAISRLDGKTLGETRLGTTLHVQVVAVVRDGERRLAPDVHTVLRGGDVLIVSGRLEELRELLHVQGVDVQSTRVADLPRPATGVSGIRLGVPEQSPMVGRSLRDLQFRDRYGVTVVGIQRGESILRDELATRVLAAGDELLALGTREQLGRLGASGEFEVGEEGLKAIQQLDPHLFLIRVREGSPLVGSTIGESRIGELVGLTIGGLIRGDETRLAIPPDEVLRAGDGLLVAGEPWRIVNLLELSEVEIEPEAPGETLESEQIGVFEVSLAPRSTVAGKTLRELDFRERYGLQVLSAWRSGERQFANLAELELRFGDALLLQGPWDAIQRLAKGTDFLVLSHTAQAPRRTARAPFALGSLLIMIGLVVAGLQPIHVAAFAAATLTILSGALRMEEAYAAVEWRAIFLVAAVLPVGTAMEETGAALLLAESVTSIAGPLGPYAVLAALVILSSMLSQALDGAPAVVLLTPVALGIGRDMGINPMSILFAISVAASCAFMTPFSHKANLLVMGAGGYRAADYLKVGTPLTIILIVIMVLLTPVLFPF